MPQTIMYLSPEIDKKVIEDSKEQKLSKMDILHNIVESYYKNKGEVKK